MEEIFRKTKGYEGYEVSNLGNVVSLDYNYSGKRQILKPILSGKRGDYRVNLCGNQVFVAQLVAVAFPEICGEYFAGAEINHKDEDFHNNAATNLEWCTKKYNNNYGTKMERSWVARRKAKYTVLQYDLNDNFIKEFQSEREAAREVGISPSNISMCCYGKQKTAGGYKWGFKKEALN